MPDNDSIHDDIRVIMQTLGDFRQEVGQSLGTIQANQKNQQDMLNEHDRDIKDHHDELLKTKTSMGNYMKIAGLVGAGLTGLESWFHKIGPWLSGKGGH